MEGETQVYLVRFVREASAAARIEVRDAEGGVRYFADLESFLAYLKLRWIRLGLEEEA